MVRVLAGGGLPLRARSVHALIDLSGLADDAKGIQSIVSSLGKADCPCFGAVWLGLAAKQPVPLATGLDPGWELHVGRPILEVANLALRRAGRAGADLLVLESALAPDAQALEALRRELERDPFFAVALPRMAGYGNRLVHKLDRDLGDPEISLIPSSVIDSMPDFYVVPNRLAPCMLIRHPVVRDFGELDPAWSTLRGALYELVARSRRVGFRCIVANRALVREPLAETGEDDGDRAVLRERYDEIARQDRAWRELPAHEHECLRGRASSPSPALRRSLVVDLAELQLMHNGTSESILGLLKGIHQCEDRWSVSLIVPPAADDYHRLSERFPEFAIDWPFPARRFTAALRPLQPWSLRDLVRLQQLALFNFVVMLDTILDDIGLEAPPGLDRVWRFLARYADGLIYISRFGKGRFRARFPELAAKEHVSHLSFRPSDYLGESGCSAGGRHLYVVGNHYPHKRMRETVDDLAAAFPYQPLKALGYEDPSVPQLEGLPAGRMSAEAVDRLYAEARAIVYPSWYEGFGFPVIRGLAHGKTVIARRSDLLSEIAAHYRGPGRLVAFESREDLVEAVGRVIHEQPVEMMPLGAALAPGEEPAGWSEVASGILRFISERVQEPESSAWQKREEAIRTMDLFAGTGTGP